MSEGPIEAKNYSFKALACRQGRDEDADKEDEDADKEDEDADEEDEEDEEDEGHKASTTSSFMLPLGHRKRRRHAAVLQPSAFVMLGSTEALRRQDATVVCCTHCMQAL